MDTDDGKAGRTSNSEEGPIADFRKTVTDRIDELREFWQTRRMVLQDLTIASWTSKELDKRCYLSPWKFNLIQSGLAALPALLLRKILNLLVPPAKPQGLEGQVNDVFSWLWPIVIPFVLLFTARTIAWGSIKWIDSTAERRARTRRAYLYLDGAYGLYPQALLSIGVVLSSVGVVLSPFETIVRSRPEGPAEGSAAASGCYAAGTLFLVVGFAWEWINKRFIFPRRLFPFIGYSRRVKWFWMLDDKGRNLAPWNKYIFSALSENL
jgi:hypothetical protein